MEEALMRELPSEGPDIRVIFQGETDFIPLPHQRLKALEMLFKEMQWRWSGTPQMFEREGFKQIGPLGTTWVLMLKTVQPSQS